MKIMEIFTKLKTSIQDRRKQDEMAASIAELEALAIEIAEIEVSAGNLELEDIPENLQDQVRVKIDDDKKLDL